MQLLCPHPHYPEANNNSAQFRQSVTLGVEIVNEQIVEMKPEFFLAIGTLGSVIITVPPKDEEETDATENELQFLNNKLTENELEKENKNTVVYPQNQYSEMPPIKEDEKEHKTTNATSYKRSGKLDKGFHFMKKMLKKLDFTSTSAIHRNTIVREKIPTKVFRKSRKIQPEAADKSHKYEVKEMRYGESYDKEVTSDDKDNTYHRVGMFKKETINNNMPFNNQPAGRKAHWIKTDADFLQNKDATSVILVMKHGGANEINEVICNDLSWLK
ncbi:hypothetical protein L1987_16581 [Smallanthus sonchifolius]|uniref:Uncharacterized protein n=1 Tax=Smallanthus sonchifolius TaxID=185202 RepID=A0ACB9IWJ8_9ASTR|nr:hypothetical protein L1987_16581 [Smallanthus sonchifolius]